MSWDYLKEGTNTRENMSKFFKLIDPVYSRYKFEEQQAMNDMQEDGGLSARSDFMRQHLCKIGIVEDSRDKYKGFLELLKRNYKIDQNILEVCCGHYPRLSEIISDEQKKLKKGSIAAIDPNLVFRNSDKFLKKIGLDKIDLKNECFTEETNIDDKQLVVSISPGIEPGELATELNAQGKEYCIMFCDHLYGKLAEKKYKDKKGFSNYKELHESYVDTAKQTLPEDKEIEIQYLADEYLDRFPVLVCKNKNKSSQN